jgi:hypothetical protein
MTLRWWSPSETEWVAHTNGTAYRVRAWNYGTRFSVYLERKGVTTAIGDASTLEAAQRMAQQHHDRGSHD